MRETTLDMLKSGLSESRLQDPAKSRWTTKELETLIRDHIRSAKMDIGLGTLHVRVHRVTKQAIAVGILRKVSRGVFEVVEKWGPALVVSTAVARALQSAGEGRLQPTHLGLGLDLQKRTCISVAVLCRGGLTSRNNKGLAECLIKIREFLADHHGVIVFYSMRVTKLKGQRGKSALVWPY